MAAKPADDHATHAHPLQYQTWVLKVSIHCEGCKKKVKKVLKGIEGVYTTVIDSQHSMVTVTGNVDAETLIKKLLRSGKYAELWPEKKEKKSSGKSENNDKQKGQEVADDNDDEIKNTAEKPDEKAAAPDDKPSETGVQGGGSGSGGKKKKKKNKEQNGNSGNGNGNSGNGVGNSGNGVGNSGNGVGGGENVGNESAGSSTGCAAGIDPIPSIASMNLSHPSQNKANYYQAAPYGVSYNTAYPSGSTSNYAPSIHAYSHHHQPGRYIPPPPSDPILKFIDNDHDYDDDKGTGCLIM